MLGAIILHFNCSQLVNAIYIYDRVIFYIVISSLMMMLFMGLYYSVTNIRDITVYIFGIFCIISVITT